VNIRVEAVSFEYPSGVQALQEVSLQIHSGEMVAMMGENGAGKTTLVKQFNGLLYPTRGAVRVGDWTTSDHTTAELAQRVGFAFQNPDMQIFERTVWREITFGPRNLGLQTNEIEDAARAALSAVGLEGTEERHPFDLQLPQRKMLALASTLVMRTPIIVLDEPTTGMDQRDLKRIRSVLRDARNQGQTVVVISHDVDFCVEQLDRTILLSEGRVLADGSTRQIVQDFPTLKEAALEPPQMLRLAAELRLEGAPLTVNEFVELYSKMKKGA
jgi:energy-coupling factor transport system ATP-binding protein